jgi:peptidoglycan pentaglycine glycine transferase (the first glycine)
LQSWEWGMFQEKTGARIARWRDADALALLVKRALPFNRSYWYAPRGPLGPDAVKKLLSANAFTGTDFFRFESAPPAVIPAKAGTQNPVKVRDVQPGQTLIINLTQESETLLAAMHEKWRYNIRLAERKGVRVYMAGEKDASALDIFWDLLSETTERDRFSAHDKKDGHLSPWRLEPRTPRSHGAASASLAGDARCQNVGLRELRFLGRRPRGRGRAFLGGHYPL